jgi:hypothetical protein
MFDVYQQLFFYFFDSRQFDRDSLAATPFAIELPFWAVVLCLTLLFCYWKPSWLSTFEIRFAEFSQRRFASIALVGILSLGLRAAMLPWVPVPVPRVHDEFSYLLQAKTFADGRLTNPPHPMWVHFETYHVNMLPTYQSMYPPGQALFLLAGKQLFGDPWFGVWLSVGLMCCSICWMLQGWMPPQWALLGGIFCVFRFSLFGLWINSYYGGAVAALGGALLLGALPRIKGRKRILVHSLLYGLGLTLLANTRPFEGFVFSLVPTVSLLVWLARKRVENPAMCMKVIACFLSILILVGAGMLYYNWRGTGQPLLMPYVVNQRAYHITKPFLGQSRYEIPQYHHSSMRKFYIFHELPDYIRSQHLWGIQEILELKFRRYYGDFFWPFIIATIPSCWIAAKSRRLRLLVLTALVLLVALLVVIWPPENQYPAPGACIAVAFVVLGVRLARTIRFGKANFGLGLSRAIVVSWMLLTSVFIGFTLVNPWGFTKSTSSMPGSIDRARLAQQLSALPGKHLIIVHRNDLSYAGSDNWIYNEPDIDRSKIVWARDMGTEKNQELLDYFSDRQIWFVSQNQDPRLIPYYRLSSRSEFALVNRYYEK